MGSDPHPTPIPKPQNHALISPFPQILCPHWAPKEEKRVWGDSVLYPRGILTFLGKHPELATDP